MKLRGSIRTQLFALVLAVALPFIGLLAYTIYADAQNRTQQARASTLSLAQLAAANTLQFLADTESLLATLAQRPAISAMNPAQCDPLLNTIPEPYPYFAKIAVIDLTGRVICTSLPYPDGALTSATHEVWFQSVKQSGAFVAGKPSLDPATGKWVSAGAYPIRNDKGELVGALGLTIDLVRYQLILDDISLPPGATLTIVDGEGTVVARSLEPEKWVGQNVRGTEIVDIVLAQDEGQAQARGFDSVDRIWGFTTVPDANWHVYVGVPTEAVFAPVRAALIPTGLLVLMSMILVAVLAGFLGQSIIKPIGALADAAQAVAGGQVEARAPVVGPREVAEVAMQFNAMLAARASAVEALRQNEHELQAIYGSMVDGVLIANTQTRFLRANAAIARMLGYSEDELLNMSVIDIHPSEYLPHIMNQFEAMVAGKLKVAENIPCLRKDDSVFFADITASQIVYHEQPCLICFFRDITERKRAEEALRDMEQRYHKLFAQSPDAVAVIDPDTTAIVEFNDAACRQLDYSREEFAKLRVFDFESAETLEETRERARELLRSGHITFETLHRARSGEIRNVMVTAQTIELSGKTFVLSIFHDITERKRAEETLQAREKHFRALIENSSDVIVLLDANAMPHYNSPAIMRVLGYAPDERVGRSALELLHPDDLPDSANLFAQLLQMPQGVITTQFRLRHKDGSWRWIDATGRNLLTEPAVQAVVVNARDITERRRVEEALRESEARYRAVVEDQTEMITRWLPDGTLTFVNEASCRYLGQARDALIGRTFTPLVLEEDLPSYLAMIESLGPANPAGTIEHRVKLPNGEIRWQQWTNRAIFNAEGQLIEFQSVGRDITERKQAETTLRKLSSAIEQTADPVFITGVDGRIEYVNSAFTAVTGFSAEEAIGQTPRLLKSGAHPTSFYQQLWESILSGNTWHGILINQKKDGEVYYAEYSITPIISPQGRIANFVAVQKDITERRRAEEEGRLLQIISLAAGGAENLRGALYLALQTVCEETNWVAGEAWIPRADGAVLECSPVWYSRVPGLENFHAASMEITCAPGVGLPGRVWASKKPVWVRDVTLDPEFVRASLAREVGFKAAMGIPVISRGEVVAVAIFFVFEPRKEDERSLGVVSAVAAQLGTVIERRLAEAALQESETRYRAIVQDQTELICRALPDGSLTFVNDAYCRYFNQTAEALLGHKSQPPIHAEDVEVVTRKRAALSIQAPTVTYWHRVSLPDGQIRWQQWTDRALFSEQGEVIEIQSVGQDITARKRAEETLKQRNEELLALNAIATTISHAPDVNRLVNDVLDELPKLLAMDGGCVYLYDEKHATRSLLLAAQRGTLPDITERLRTIHLGETPAAEAGAAEEPAALIAHVLKMFEVSGWEVGPGCAGAPIQAKDKMLGVLCLFRRGPNELSRHERQTLATIGHQIGVAIENVRLAEQTVEIEILRELDRLRSELIANVSHELRTPLGLIMLFCTTLLQQEVDLDRETQREFLNDIKEEADRLEKIVNNLLDLSRVQNGRLYLDRQPTDIARLVRATLASVRPQFTAHRLVYDFPPQPLVTVADSKRVEQVLRNLVSNAVKYSPVGGEITIRGSSTENEIMIQVSDQGVGIPPQDLTRVFERFYRVANETTQQVDGVGLGLAVCQGIVEAHGGRIWVESTPGAGSTFYFTLPAGLQAEAEAE